MELIKQNFQTKLIKSILAVVLGSIILTISAKIKIPFYPVPMTMQTFVVMFLGIVLGYRLATLTVILYLIEGSFGLPVFAKGGGIGYLLGPTGGYLIGFIFTAFFAGHIDDKKDPIVVFLYLLFSANLFAQSYIDYKSPFHSTVGDAGMVVSQNYFVLLCIHNWLLY